LQYSPLGQFTPQPPQFWLSDWVFAQIAPHCFVPLGQEAVQLPLTQA
jgi:hypothetical protein